MVIDYGKLTEALRVITVGLTEHRVVRTQTHAFGNTFVGTVGNTPDGWHPLWNAYGVRLRFYRPTERLHLTWDDKELVFDFDLDRDVARHLTPHIIEKIVWLVALMAQKEYPCWTMVTNV
jgi:hypothetical protein